MRNSHRIRAVLMLSIVGATSQSLATHADEHRRVRTPLLPKYQQECGSCHVAYPPDLLPQASWRRIISGLSKHYGTDASIDAASVADLSAWLTVYSATPAREPPPDDRISRSAWFVREHDELSVTAWRHREVKSAANCGACHTQADKGDYSERNVKIPR